MIFLTVGSNTPFDRLVKTVDAWAEKTQDQVFAQIGNSTFLPKHMKFEKALSPPEYERKIIEADLIIAHAGMGSIISALVNQKPIIIIPRKASLGETRNEHQWGTAREMQKVQGVTVAKDDEELLKYLNQRSSISTRPKGISTTTNSNLVKSIRSILTSDKEKQITKDDQPRKVLAVSSSGGHWIQLLRLNAAFQDCHEHYVCTDASRSCDIDQKPFFSVVDSSRWTKHLLALQAVQIFKILLKIRPDYIISTGASLGYFAMLFGNKLGATTIWVDSIANVDKISLSGQKAIKHAHYFFTQWQKLADGKKIQYKGSVLEELELEQSPHIH